MKNSLKHIDTLEKWNILSSAMREKIIIDGKCNTVMMPKKDSMYGLRNQVS
jgi:hypothetical protein